MSKVYRTVTINNHADELQRNLDGYAEAGYEVFDIHYAPSAGSAHDRVHLVFVGESSAVTDVQVPKPASANATSTDTTTEYRAGEDYFHNNTPLPKPETDGVITNTENPQAHDDPESTVPDPPKPNPLSKDTAVPGSTPTGPMGTTAVTADQAAGNATAQKQDS